MATAFPTRQMVTQTETVRLTGMKALAMVTEMVYRTIWITIMVTKTTIMRTVCGGIPCAGFRWMTSGRRKRSWC